MLILAAKILVFILGASLGSFLNVVIYRLPRGLSLIRPGSSCPACGARIAWSDNVPLLSYFLLRGRCRRCGGTISARYPMVELMAGLLTLAVFVKSGPSLRALAELYLVLGLVAVTFIDLEAMIIPDRITLPGMAVGLGAAVLAPDQTLLGPWLGGWLMEAGLTQFRLLSLSGSILGLLLGGGLVWVIFQLYYLVRKEEGIGGGDFTLLAMIGAFLGWRAVLVTMFLGSVAGLAAAVGTGLRQGELRARMKLPFGPFLSLGALIYLFYGESLLRWYWS